MKHEYLRSVSCSALGVVLALFLSMHPVFAAKPGATPQTAPVKTADEPAPASIGPTLNLVIGKSTLLRMPAPIDRVSVGAPDVADVTLINPRELYLIGKSVGVTNVILWSKSGQTTIVDVIVNIDGAQLEERFRQLMPGEPGIKVSSAAGSVVLSGTVSSSLRVNQAVAIADAYVRNLNRGLVLPVVAGDTQAQSGTAISIGRQADVGSTVNAAGSGIINLLQVTSPQQVMLEVKVAEVNKNLLDSLGAQFNLSRTNGDWAYSIISSFLSDSAGLLTAAKSPTKLFQIDAEKTDGLVKILAEPNLIAISGQEAEFLAGGRIFIPVARDSGTGGTTITLEEKEFGVGLKFTPTVLEGGRINLRVAPEVSELSQTGTPFTTVGGVTAVIPSFTTRRAATTVQLHDGQSFAIAGLIRSNVTETVRRFPVLGEVPILGALFRSSEFQADRSELMFVVTPRLVKPLPPNYALPTDSYIPPDRGEFFLEGKMEGNPGSRSDQVPAVRPAGAGGFEVK